MTATEDDVQAWLERQADHYMDGGLFTSDVLPGITGFGVRVDADLGPAAGPLERFEPRMLVFYATWAGIEMAAARSPAGVRR